MYSGIHEALGKYLKQKRILAGITQAELARHLGYSTAQFVSNCERGLCSPPIKSLPALSKVLDIPQQEIIDVIMKEQEKLLKEVFSETKRKKVK